MNLREAAQQALEAYDAHEPLAVVMEALRAALAEPEQEPVAWMNGYGDVVNYKCVMYSTPLYTQPPQRQPLTDEEIDAMWNQHRASPNWLVDLTRAIERAHGIGGKA
jgi:hypothetical protein